MPRKAQRGRRPVRWTGEEVAGLREAYCDLNQKTATIAARYDVHFSRITQLAHRHGWPLRRVGRPPKPNGIRSMTPQQRTAYFKLRTIMPAADALAEVYR